MGTVERKGKRTGVQKHSKAEMAGATAWAMSEYARCNAGIERMRAAAAAYSTSTTSSLSVYGGTSTTASVGMASAAAVGTNGAAVGAAVGASLSRTAYKGAIGTVSNTVSYSGAAAYQASIIAEQRIKDYNNELQATHDQNVSSYLEKTVIMPGQSISGRVNFDYIKADYFYMNIPVGGVIYQF